MNQLTK